MTPFEKMAAVSIDHNYCLWLTLDAKSVAEFREQAKDAKHIVDICLELDGERIEMTYDEFKSRLTAAAPFGLFSSASALNLNEPEVSATAGGDYARLASDDHRLLKRLRGEWDENTEGCWPATDAMDEAARLIVTLAREHRDLLGGNRALRLQLQAAERLAEQRGELLRELREWLDSNTTFYDVDADWPVEGPNIPTLAQVSNRIWYHATDDLANYPFSAAIDAALSREPAQGGK